MASCTSANGVLIRTRGSDMASYRAAIAWMVLNDDTEWVDNGDPQSVTAALVADLFGKDDDKVLQDLKRLKAKLHKEKVS